MKATWTNRRHGIRLYRGDCLRVLPALRCQADFLLADPCYGTTNAAWDVAHDYAALLPALSKRLKPGAVQAWFACGKFTFTLAGELGRLFRYDLIWEKSDVPDWVDDGTRYPRSVLKFSTPAKGGPYWHPTQKPVPLLEWLIRTYTNPGDLVLDFCFGSGSTAIACINTGRRFIGCEKDRTFFRRAVMRIETHLAGK